MPIVAKIEEAVVNINVKLYHDDRCAVVVVQAKYASLLQGSEVELQA